jgi:hypothetical protein
LGSAETYGAAAIEGIALTCASIQG